MTSQCNSPGENGNTEISQPFRDKGGYILDLESVRNKPTFLQTTKRNIFGMSGDFKCSGFFGEKTKMFQIIRGHDGHRGVFLKAVKSFKTSAGLRE